MVSPAERRLERVLRPYINEQIDGDYLDLYVTPSRIAIDDPLERAFASIHERLDIELDLMNQKARTGVAGHFNADNGRTFPSNPT